MQKINFSTGGKAGKWFILVAVLLTGVFLQTNTHAFTLTVLDPDGVAVPAGFRWLLEEDVTYAVDPANPADTTDPVSTGQTLALNFHKSYMPVVDSGESFTNSIIIDVPDTTKRYFVSVLPFPGGFSMSGAPVAPGQDQVIVTLNPHPVPTAQISVFVFEDNNSINSAPDLPAEQGLEGFDVKVFDAGGRYGLVGGQQFTDVFGNPLGTTYERTCDAGGLNPGSGTNICDVDADGSPDVLVDGSGTILSNADGFVIIKNLAPGKYGIVVTPPAGQGWQQTSTIEGSTTIDAWVKANEPPFFTEFGPPGQHVFVGFVQETNDTSVLIGGATISGRVVNNHLSRPPDTTFYEGIQGLPDIWIGLNDLGAGGGRGVYAHPANTNGTFNIAGVPAGTYELVIWEKFLNTVISIRQLNVPTPAPATIDLGDVAINNWFGRLQGSVFYDELDVNGFANGFRDLGEIGIPDQAVVLRFRDGTVYDATTTDLSGAYSFPKVFPFFSWLVAEVDFLRMTATGATVAVDGGGLVPPHNGWDMPSFDRLNPQVQDQVNLNTQPPNNLSWTEASDPGEDLLTLGVQTFLGQTNVIDWGKRDYDPAIDQFPNGGISGIVFYDTTRAENKPRWNVGEEWQPGIPRIQVNLYRDCNDDGIIDDPDLSDPNIWACSTLGSENPDTFTLADVDNYPFGFGACRDVDGLGNGVDETGSACTPEPDGVGPEDTDSDGDGLLDFGDAVDVTWTDSWDDEVPTGCPGDPLDFFYNNGKCYDGLRNYNQVRPALFDGGYAFSGLVSGTYIVEVGQHPVYQVVKTQDKNVDFGDEYTPSPLLLPPVCVGDPYEVPIVLSLFPGVTHPFYDPADPDYVPVSDHPVSLNDCDRKQVEVYEGLNAAAEFFLFTAVPPAAHIKGFILDDAANEFDRNHPNFGEKYAPPNLPVQFYDWNGVKLNRVYSDWAGTYNLLVPSTYTANIPNASGFSPAMLIGCMNDAGPIEDTDSLSPTFGEMIIDPFYQRQYSQFCYTFQYMPGAITYLDTPVLPVAAFAGQAQFPLDCEFPDGTPVIFSAKRLGTNGPYIDMTDPNKKLEILSLGSVDVPDPTYNGTGSKTVLRDYGFGATPGTVTIGGIALENVVWAADGSMITGDVPAGTPGGKYQLMVTRDNGLSTVMGVTVVVSPIAGNVLQVAPSTNPSATPIQDAIDIAQPDDLILVAPGVYEEMVILWKDVQLQGCGAPSTTINAIPAPGEKLLAWRQKVEDLVTGGFADLLPFQEAGFAGFEPAALFTEEGAGIIVLPAATAFGPDSFGGIDGFTITGSTNGGGIVVNGYGRFLEISNNRIIGNAGVFGGGIRSGHPYIDTVQIVDAENDNLNIHHNHVNQNGATGVGAGGGISLYTGSDNYAVTENYICGNFTTGDGGGIGHQGLSHNSLITDNMIFFNQNFNQGASISGGGISIAGVAPLAAGGLTAGSGSVVIDSNIIQGNLAGAGDGGGIRLSYINGQDVEAFTTLPGSWYSVDIVNNMIVNNVAGLAGGGISMQDAARPNIINNTIANNDSTATAGLAFESLLGQTPTASTPQPAGVVSRAHSADLAALMADLAASGATGPEYAQFSNPQLVNNIIWHNRSFNFVIDFNTQIGTIVPETEPWIYNDLAVLPDGAGPLDPLYCLLTDITGLDPSKMNITGDPGFLAEYFNGGLGSIFGQPEANVNFDVAAAVDEGGNFIDVRFSPLTRYDDPPPADGNPGTLFGDYHIPALSPAENAGTSMAFTPAALDALLDLDIDEQARPASIAGVDIGADEFTADVGGGDVNSSCLADMQPSDGDVDGADLVNATVPVAIIAAEFGRIDCLE